MTTTTTTRGATTMTDTYTPAIEIPADPQFCWCGASARYLVPIDPEVTPWDGLTAVDGQPHAPVCATPDHVRDGYTPIPRTGLEAAVTRARRTSPTPTRHAYLAGLIRSRATLAREGRLPRPRDTWSHLVHLAEAYGHGEIATMLRQGWWEWSVDPEHDMTDMAIDLDRIAAEVTQ